MKETKKGDARNVPSDVEKAPIKAPVDAAVATNAPIDVPSTANDQERISDAVEFQLLTRNHPLEVSEVANCAQIVQQIELLKKQLRDIKNSTDDQMRAELDTLRARRAELRDALTTSFDPEKMSSQELSLYVDGVSVSVGAGLAFLGVVASGVVAAYAMAAGVVVAGGNLIFQLFREGDVASENSRNMAFAKVRETHLLVAGAGAEAQLAPPRAPIKIWGKLANGFFAALGSIWGVVVARDNFAEHRILVARAARMRDEVSELERALEIVQENEVRYREVRIVGTLLAIRSLTRFVEAHSANDCQLLAPPGLSVKRLG